jgi:(p)ppGpp synthase/HD superfamily hydrolase
MNVKVGIQDRQFVENIQSEPLNVRIPLYFALIAAILLHFGKERRIGGRAVEHPMVVAELAKESKLGLWAQIVSLFHDLIEDCEWPLKIMAIFVLLFNGPTVSFAVLALTNWYRKNTRRYFLQIIWATKLWWPIIFIKLLDRLHNLVCPYGGSREKELKKLEETLKSFQAMCRLCRRFVPKERLADYNEKLEQVIMLAKARKRELTSTTA